MQVPLRWVPLRRGARCGDVALLDLGPPRCCGSVRMRYAGVLVDLAEQVLAVDELELPSPQIPERQPQALELVLRPFGHGADDLGLGEAPRVREALLDAAASPWPCNDEGHLREVDDL